MTYQCVVTKVKRTPTIKIATIIMTTSTQFLVGYLLKSPSNDKVHHLAR